MAIVRMHERFLRRNRADLSQKKRRLPMRIVEQLGIETLPFDDCLCQVHFIQNSCDKKSKTKMKLITVTENQDPIFIVQKTQTQ